MDIACARDTTAGEPAQEQDSPPSSQTLGQECLS